MVEKSDERSSTYQLHHSGRAANAPRNLYGGPDTLNDSSSHHGRRATPVGGPGDGFKSLHSDTNTANALSNQDVSEKPVEASPPPAPPPNQNVQEEASSSLEAEEKPNIFNRFYRDCKGILLASWINTLLVFVPVGIAVHIAGVTPTIVFAMNAIAIVPLAGLLSYATESVASDMGDTIGALMNVTFGNAVELIIL